MLEPKKRACAHQKMPPQKLRHGVCSVLLKRLHPAMVASDKHPSLSHGQRLSELIILRKE
jgi:hypothetical protein